MNFINDYIRETLFFYNEIAIYLLLGFLIAGLLHVFFPDSIIKRHLGKNSLGAVIKSSLFGMPLPICSCGVVPVAASLRQSGASKGATISFLVSTPQVGADSFMITYSLMGWVFGVFRIVASLITALIAGIAVNLLDKTTDNVSLSPIKAETETVRDRLKTVASYVEYQLLGSIINALLIGILVAGLISSLLPDIFFEQYLNSPFLSMVLMLVIGIPMYVCASASTPIAASLILKGMSPGAALVFLLTGPATNAMSIAAVSKIVGKRATIIYLIIIAVVSLALGFLLNLIVAYYGFSQIISHHQHDFIPESVKIAGSVGMTLMIIIYYSKNFFNQGNNNMTDQQIAIDVDGMTCMHCASSVQKAVESVGASNVAVDLDGKQVKFDIVSMDDIDKVKAEITSAGFTVRA